MNQVKLIFLILFCCHISAFAQQKTKADEPPIKLVNPSFEDVPSIGNGVRGWYTCGAVEESPPDVHPQPDPNQAFRVSQKPYNGNSYLGMVVRSNDSWESVGQQLSKALEKGKCYAFAIHLCRSDNYESKIRGSEKIENFTTPARLRIWGGSGFCSKKELLGETSLVTNTRWIEYAFEFNPKQNHEFILLEAFYNTPTLFPYNGNLLLDNATDIKPVPCDESKKQPVADVSKEERKPIATKPTPPPVKPAPAKPKDTVIADVTAPSKVEQKKESKILADLDRKKIKEGSIIKIDRLFFNADSSTITTESYPVLEEVYKFLLENAKVVIEIGGHTNNVPADDFCDALSKDRAKAVADFLMQKGISDTRLIYKGYGKRKPIASNLSTYGRKQNQRVEIKILSVNG